jgi:CRISPR-associated protein Cas1
MGTLYITQQGAVLKRVSRRLMVYKGDEKIAEVPAIKVDRVLLFGNIQVTAQTVAFLLDFGIDLCYLSSRGKYRGRLVPATSKNVLLRVAQYERYLDDKFQLEMSKALVEAKLKSSLGLIRRYDRSYPTLDFSQETDTIQNALNSISSQIAVSSLLGIEGTATAAYFKAFSRMFRKEDMTFTKRTRRPPKDPVNALLSFGYTLVTNEILSFLFAVGFDPYIGYYHSLDYGRPSLALDMTEEFRHPVVDRFTLYLVNNSIISYEDFDDKGEEGFLLKQDALKRYFQHYEKRITDLFHDKISGENVNYRNLFRRQAYRIAETIKTGQPYEPYVETE